MVEKQSREITFAEGTAIFAVFLTLVVGFVNAMTAEYHLEKHSERLQRLEKIVGMDEIGRRK